jgi:taurine---2-oxoglutarate transaminase
LTSPGSRSAYPFFFTWSEQRSASPLRLASGRGAWFSTEEGERWLDLGSMVFQANAGHGHPRIVEAIREQASRLCLGAPNAIFPAKIELAERLLDMAPPGFSKVFFTLGGSDAVENALKMARLATGRHKLLSRYRSYHGATMGALSLTGDWRRPPLEPGLPGVVRALDCYCDRCPFGKSVDSCSRECAAHIAEVLDLEGPRSIAAVVLEPVPGASGVLVPPPGYWADVRRACDAHGTLLIADEVLTGFGRTGRWLACEHMGVTPDMITLGKALTGGYATLGAVLVHERVACCFEESPLYAGLTGYAHPLGCAAGAAAIKVYEEEGLVAKAAELEPTFLEALRAMAGRHGSRIPFVRGLGLLAAMEIEATPEEWLALEAAVRDRRVHVHLRSRLGMVLLAPPLCIEKEDLLHGLGLLDEAIAESMPAPATPGP